MNGKWFYGIVACACIATVATMVIAQPNPQPKPAEKPKYGTCIFKAKVGSFHLEGEGTVTMNFRGTLLISGFSGTPPVITGNVRKEWDKYGRTIWFGSGKATISGKWRKIQWFGGDLDAVWVGSGLGNLYGEYDENGKSGTYKVDDGPEMSWYTTGITMYNPKEANPYWREQEAAQKAAKEGRPNLPNQ